MHSISTSVRIGSSFTATHVRHYDSSCQLERYFVLPSLAVHSTRWWETIENEIRQPQLLVWSWCHVFESSGVAIPFHSRASSSTSLRKCALKVDFAREQGNLHPPASAPQRTPRTPYWRPRSSSYPSRRH